MTTIPRRQLPNPIAFAGALLMLACPGCPSGSKPEAITSELSCSLDGVDQPKASDPDVTVDKSTTSGSIKGDTVRLKAGDTLRLDGDLTLVAYNTLYIDGVILLPSGSSSKPAPNILLVSIAGNVQISAGAYVGGGKAARGDSASAGHTVSQVRGGNGGDGGKIKIIASAQSIIVEGPVVGQDGGDGGPAYENAQSYSFQNTTNAIGGKAGKGGPVSFCARELITVASGGKAVGGNGGAGGNATARSDRGKNANARSGQGAGGGDVNFISSSSFTPVDVRASDTVRAGRGGDSGNAAADSLRAANDTSKNFTTATADTAGKGASINFIAGAKYSGGATLQAGDGGNGGTATATAPNGYYKSGVVSAGGDATATGGTGGKGGPVPVWNPSAAGADGSGGRADATPGGGGGLASGVTVVVGGASGTGTAQGGSNGGGTSPGAPDVSGPVNATGKAGATTRPAGQAGAT